MCGTKLPPNLKRGINTIFNHFRNTHARNEVNALHDNLSNRYRHFYVYIDLAPVHRSAKWRNAVQLYFSRVSSSVNIYLVFSFHLDEFQVTRAL